MDKGLGRVWATTPGLSTHRGKKKVAIAVGIGVVSGVTGGVLVSIMLCGRLRVIHGSASLETLQALLPKGGVLRKPE